MFPTLETVRRLQKRALRPFAGTKQKGMTLMEILIVIALLATLMAILVSNLAGTSDRAKEDQANIAMANIGQVLQLYKVHNNKFPTTAQGLEALLNDPGEGKRWRGPYLEENKLKDPWGNPFGYTSDGRKFEISSMGPDGVASGDDIFYPPHSEAAPAAAPAGEAAPEGGAQ